MIAGIGVGRALVALLLSLVGGSVNPRRGVASRVFPSKKLEVWNRFPDWFVSLVRIEKVTLTPDFEEGFLHFGVSFRALLSFVPLQLPPCTHAYLYGNFPGPV
jgi:hypothetical protein